jgi:hypothetical protein
LVMVGARTVFSTIGYILAYGQWMTETDVFLNSKQGMCQPKSNEET